MLRARGAALQQQQRRPPQQQRRRGLPARPAASMRAPEPHRSRHRPGSRSPTRLASLPEDGLPGDGHHAPQENPEALLLVQQEEAAELQQPLAPPPQQRRRQRQAGRGRRLRVPFLGLTVTPELCAISLVYFVQGILGLSRLALSFFFKDDLGVEPAQVAVLTGLAGLPWVVKPLYGFISDSVPLWGYRRRSYLVLCGLAGSASWLALAVLVHSPSGAVAAMLLGSLSTACSDVVVDSLVVERARGEPASTAGSLQSLCWASSAVGGIASAYFSGSLVEAYGSQAVFGLTAIFPLLVTASALLIDEQRVTQGMQPLPAASAALASQAGARQQQRGGVLAPAAAAKPLAPEWSRRLGRQLVSQGTTLWGAVKQRHILLPTLFVFLWQATPSADTAMFYFYTNALHFSPEFLGRVRLAGSVASLAGVALYNTCFKTVPLKRMLLAAMLLGVGLGSTQLLLVSGVNRSLGLSDELFVLGDSVILTVLGQVSFMPILVLAARLCPEGVEATLFATLMSILNSGSFVGSALGAGLTASLGVTSTDFSNLFLLLVLTNVSTLLPAPFLGLLPASLDQSPPGDGPGAGEAQAQAQPAGGRDGARSAARGAAAPAVGALAAGAGSGGSGGMQLAAHGARGGAAHASSALDAEEGMPLKGG